MITTIRLLTVAALVLLVQAVGYMMQRGAKPPSVELLNWSIQDMPLRFGVWHGELTDLDPKIFVRIGATDVVNRMYQDRKGRKISLHVALFNEYDVGAFHNPQNCYRSSGWQLIDSERLKIDGPDGKDVSLGLMTWRREGEQVMVAHWYQLGKHIALDRVQLGLARLKLRGRKTWPPLVKVLLQIPADDPEEAKTPLKDFTQQVYQWVNRSDHQPTADVRIE